MWCNCFAQVLCVFVLMQSSFTFHEMESTSELPSPMAAAASDKRKFRTCSNCTSRKPSIDFDAHTLCIGCRHQVCDLTVYCDECRNWSDTYRSAFVKYNRTLKLSVIIRVGAGLGYQAQRNPHQISLFAIQTQKCLL